MKLRSFLSALAAGSLVLLLIAAGVLYWVLAQSPLFLAKGGVMKNPATTIFVSRQAPVMVSLLVNPDRLEAFRQLVAHPRERRRSRAELNQIKESLLANTGLDYHQDIQPWLGNEISLAISSLDFDRNRENGVQPGYLLAVTTKDSELAREFLQLFYSQQAIAGISDLVFEQYKGVNLIYRRPLEQAAESSGSLASAVVGDRFVLFANHPKVLRDAINNVQVADLNLKNSPSYQKALQTIEAPRIGVSFVNLPAVAAWLANEPAPETSDLEKMLTLALSLNRQGLVAETALLGAAGEESKAPVLSETVGALQYIPAKSVLTAAGTDLDQLWSLLSTELAADNPLEQLLNQSLAKLEDRWGIDLPQDIFSWIQGEYALSLSPNPERSQPDWVFVAEKAAVTTPEAEAAIEHLDTLAKEQGFSVGNLPLASQTITAWTELTTTSNVALERRASFVRLNAQVKGVHATAGKYEIFTTSIEAMSQALGGKENSLVESEKFQQAIAPLPQDNDGYFYIDWHQSQPIFEQKLPAIRVIELAGKPLFDHLQTLTLSSHGSENGVSRATIFFNLGAKVE